MRTSTVKDIAHQGRRLTLLNQREHGARRGLIVSGEWTTGKTTALKQLGRLHELRVRQRYPGRDRIPVVHITAPPKSTSASPPRARFAAPAASGSRNRQVVGRGDRVSARQPRGRGHAHRQPRRPTPSSSHSALSVPGQRPAPGDQFSRMAVNISRRSASQV
ncbi:hypothetical protein [Streptomyces europaeiscabiei]|uniref:hypothetical protein n=1 Tax=Streptomyces europaeiscabiei TaxID=146819 RepID=UPI0039998A1E